jgi:hypothetical protein
MHQSKRLALVGTYRTPRFKIGQIVMDEIRGEVRIVGMTDGKIAWPIGSRVGTSRRPGAILYGDILKAIRLESRQAVAHWFGVSQWQVGNWRNQLGIAGEYIEGTHRLRKAYGREPWFKDAQRLAWAKSQDPARREKIAESKRGKPRPAHVVAKMRTANVGKKVTPETREKMSKTHRARGTRPPWLNPAWSKREDALLAKVPVVEVAERTGRTVVACRLRRSRLGLPDGRRRRT